MSKRADRIKEKVSLLEVLSAYGYDVRGWQREQQFKCDLHGDGSDNAPSARVYPETDTWFCFACGKSRDVISTVMEKEGLEFSSACRALEKKYGLEEWTYTPKKDIFEEVSVPTASDLERLQKRIRNKLEEMTRSRVDYESTLKYWEAYNMLATIEGTEVQWERLYRAIF